MKVLIIGATGMLARPVIKQMAMQGLELRLFSRTIESDSAGNNFEIVRGDLFHPEDLQKAISGCDAIHINLSRVNEATATITIVKAAKQNGIKLISYISGCTVSEENRWFWMIDNKYQAEQAIINSGIPYLIFRPTWFFESLPLMIRNGKATLIGKQPNPYRWIAADDYGRMVAKAYQIEESKNRIFNIYGNETHYMKDLLLEYCRHLEPKINKISTAPIGLLKLIALLSRNNELKTAISLFSYFEKVKEPGNADETNDLLGKPEINFKEWLESQAKSFK